MQNNNNIFGKLLTPINRRRFKYFVDKYNGDFASKKLSCWEQFIAIFLGQMSNCSSLREIETVVNFHSNEHYHLGLKHGNISKSTLANANQKRDWRIYRDIFLDLIKNLPEFQCNETKEFIKIIDSSPIILNCSQHDWVLKNNVFSGLKLHVLYDLNSHIPTYFSITSPKVSDIKEARTMTIESNTTYVVDKGYLDYNWLNIIDDNNSYFVTRLKKNSSFDELTELQITNELISSQIIGFNRKWNRGLINRLYKKPLKRVLVKREGKEPLALITNDFKRSDIEIAELYKKRWQIELFFKWIKQNLKIKKFLGKNENAIKTQICIAMIGYVLIKLMQKLKKVCEYIPLKFLITVIKNGLFTRLSTKPPNKNHSESFQQLHFNLACVT